jgi:archaemetzincin
MIALTVLLLAVAAAGKRDGDMPNDAERARTLAKQIECLRPLHRKLGEPEPGDWLAVHEEPGQTFRQYLRSRPVRPTGERRVIYIQPLGQFDETQRKIIDQTGEFLAQYFGLEVEMQEDIPLSAVPDDARRRHPTWGDRQILTTYVLKPDVRQQSPRGI